jgi:NADPH-dependent 2,4-dienoyl-CoA reductase/sulfur reductase-like enzyme
MKVIIVGGVAGGASCAARLRRLDEAAEIVMVERGPYVSGHVDYRTVRRRRRLDGRQREDAQAGRRG